ncbi:uncharacterized protein BX664DRAFT_332351 [Halteromyces radiatus]|uniref:uncharacterized protein n=1 Tax=Halteromyces radiatus TaxID=101107 RepID=UPI0022211254|nr:uncharacterized protein BX664DRAFT_332351 [Halteromyces radiatus]KAI8089173.1 hypothetical protein BX664DRAFT_332351 [Halteromyces radiatus]
MLLQVHSINQVKKYWLYLLSSSIMILLLYMTFTTSHLSIISQHTNDNKLSPSLVAAAHGTDDPFSVWYPIETALLELFPKEAYTMIFDLNNTNHQQKQQLQHTRGSLMYRLFHWFSQTPERLSFSWASYYQLFPSSQQLQLDQNDEYDDDFDTTSSHPCHGLSLPYPIIRHLVKQSLQLNESKAHIRLFDDDDDSDIHPYLLPDLSTPFVLLPFDPRYHSIAHDQPICIRAIIPPAVLTKHPTSPFHYRYQPYPASTNIILVNGTEQQQEQTVTVELPMWWDMMQISARHLQTNATVPLDLIPWQGHHKLREGYQKKWFEHANNVPDWSRKMMEEMDERHWIHVYEAGVELPDPGHYVFEAKLEFQDAYWNAELGPVQPYQPMDMPVEPSAKVTVQKENHMMESTEKLVLDHLSLPLCKGGRGDYHGRWLPWTFDNNNNNSMVIGLDRYGKFWAPTTCRYRHITHAQFHRCLAKRYPQGMNIYGDSNMRRSIKSFISHGQWCKSYEKYQQTSHHHQQVNATVFQSPQQWSYLGDPRQLRACQCEDFEEVTWNATWFNATARRWDIVFENNQETTQRLGRQTEWDNNNNNYNGRDGIRVSSYKWDGLTFMNDQGWEAGFVRTNYKLPTDTDIVVISLVNWDMAYTELTHFQEAVVQLIQHIKMQYHSMMIVYRTPQYYCCRVDHTQRQRKSNTARLKTFDKVARQLFQIAFGSSLMIWDTMSLGEARTWGEKLQTATCGANHAQADVIHLENQILMNALCNPQ